MPGACIWSTSPPGAQPGCQQPPLCLRALTSAAKYSVSVSLPPWARITSVTAASTAQICQGVTVSTLRVTGTPGPPSISQYPPVPPCARRSWTPRSAAPC